MRIENHWLKDDSGEFDMDRREIARPGYSFKPETILLHYDVTNSIDTNTAALFSSGLSYHVAVNGVDYDLKRPRIRQYVPFDKRAVHAKGQNHKAIGLCVVNPGPLIRGKNGILRTVYGTEWEEDDAIEVRHAGGKAPKNWTHWAVYSHEERDCVLAICEALLATYPSIHSICGHDYVDPGRKFDPGPAFEEAIMPYVRGAFPEVDVFSVAS